MECYRWNPETHGVGHPRGAFSVSVFNKALPVPSQRQELERASRLFSTLHRQLSGKGISFDARVGAVRAPTAISDIQPFARSKRSGGLPAVLQKAEMRVRLRCSGNGEGADPMALTRCWARACVCRGKGKVHRRPSVEIAPNAAGDPALTMAV